MLSNAAVKVVGRGDRSAVERGARRLLSRTRIIEHVPRRAESKLVGAGELRRSGEKGESSTAAVVSPSLET